MSIPLEERLWRRVNKNGPVPAHRPELGPCWLWTGATVEGYGSIGIRGAYPRGTHRVSWELAHGAIPPGVCVLHHCDARTCVNPDHLFLGTPADNIRDMDAKGRRRSPRGSGHWASKFTEEQVREIRRTYVPRRNGGTYELARRYGVTREAIRDIVKGKIWRHVV
jgi:hypothetical protein